MPRDNLQDGTYSIADQAERNRLLAAELVAQGEGKDGAAEGTELEDVRLISPPIVCQVNVPRNSSM